MTTHLEARRTAQTIVRIWRVVRALRRRGRLTAADAELRAFQCGDVLVVPSGVWRAWMELRDEIERLRS